MFSLNVSSFALLDIDGLGSSAIGGQLIRKASTQSPFTSDKNSSDNMVAGKEHAGQVFLPELQRFIVYYCQLYKKVHLTWHILSCMAVVWSVLYFTSTIFILLLFLPKTGD